VWRAATAAGVAGWVKNTADGLHIEAKGSQAALDAFVLVLSTQQPAAARVGSVHVDRIADEHVAYGQAVVARARLARAAEQPERN
jgi:hydrogenase maturation protein HypF